MMSKVVVTICLSFFALIAMANKEVPEVSVTIINCEMNQVDVMFSLPEFGTCQENATVKLKPGETFNCLFTPKEVRPYAVQAYAPTGALTLLPIMYHGFCIGVAKADYGYQYVPCDESCLKTATDYTLPYKDLAN